MALTGASGFVGRRLLDRLVPSLISNVTCFTRHPDLLIPRLRGRAGWRAVPADLPTMDRLADLLAGHDTVVHLAAVTGKAAPAEYARVIVEGTRVLLTAADSAGVRRFVFVSSVAAGFPDQRFYPYAAAKAAAELLVRASGLDWTIVRPTMVFGPGSPVQAGLTRLATAPVGIVFGSGEPMVAPIHVDDLVDLLLALLARDPLGRVMIEARGPESVSLKDLLRQIRIHRLHRPGPFVHLPLEPLRTLLGALEPLLRPLLPFTAGQLATFVNPGGSGSSDQTLGLPAPRRGLEAMLHDG